MKTFVLLFLSAVICITTAQECVNPNEEWIECGTACPTTCQNYKNPPQFCVLSCKIGCACKSPYIRDETSGRCVLTRDCGNTE